MRFLLLLVLSIFCRSLQAQTYTSYPDILTLNAFNGALVNPGYVSDEGRGNLFAGYKLRTGALKDVGAGFFTAEKTFRKENESAHAARIILSTEKEGPYISRPRGYANYAYQVPVNESLFLHAGISLGVAGSYFSVPGASGNQSSTLPDGGIGLGIHSERFSLGAACLQMLNSVSKPYNSNIILGRYYHFHGNYNLPLGLDWKLKSQLLWRHLPATQDQIYGLLSVAYRDFADLGSVYKVDGGISFFLALQPDYKEDRLLFSFTYNSAISGNGSPLQNSMEVTVGFRIR